jgi:hypothetical protein
MDFDSEKAMRFGGIPRWHHVDCFVQCRVENEFWDCVDIIPGFMGLSADDKIMVKGKLPAMKA